MNHIRRFVLSLRRNYTKMVPLFFIVFILGNIVCSAVAIRQSTMQTREEFLKSYGTKIELGYSDGISERIGEATKAEYQKVDHIFRSCSSLPLYQYSNIAYSSTQFSSPQLKYEESGIRYYEKEDMSLYLWGISSSIPIEEKRYETELISGRHFSEEELEDSANVVLVSENFRIKENDGYRNVEIGERITIQGVIYSDQEIKYMTDEEFEVVGIYRRSDYIQQNEKGYSIDNNLTQVMLPLSTLERMNDAYNEKCKEYGANGNHKLFAVEAYFQLRSEKDYDDFIACYNEAIGDDHTLPFGFEKRSSDEIYEKISQPIESLSSIADFIFLTSSLVSMVVLSLIIFIILRNRKHEIGIYRALGEKKGRIILQFVLEIYTVGILALGLSTYTGCRIGEAYSAMMIEQEEMSDELDKELAELYDVEYTAEYIYGVFIIGSFIMIGSSIVPVVYILKSDPKKILM